MIDSKLDLDSAEMAELVEERERLARRIRHTQQVAQETISQLRHFERERDLIDFRLLSPKGTEQALQPRIDFGSD